MRKYGTLNLKRVRRVLSNCEPAFELLFIVGFTIAESDNQERIIWNHTSNNMILIKDVYSILSLDVESMKSLMCLLNDGYEYKEAMNAINLRETSQQLIPREKSRHVIKMMDIPWNLRSHFQ